MKLKIMLLGTVASLSLIAVQESQARHQGWYLGLEAGANWVDDTDFVFDFGNPPSAPPFFASSIDFETGWAALGTIGYAFESHWRIEGEFGYRSNDTDNYLVGPVSTPRSRRGGDLTEYTAMVNVLYDIPLSERLDITFGLGAGVDYAEFDDGAIAGNDDDFNFAYQAIAGLSYELTNRLDLTLNYRYLHVDEPEFAGPHLAHVDTYAFEDLEKHTVTVGLRYDLYEDEAPVMAAPPPPPAPAVEPTKQFIVFFGFNKSNLTPEALSVVQEAAAAAKSQGSASIIVVGHTDTVGSNTYNDGLSMRRSGAVKAGLIAEGIAASGITTSGKGESELLVQTGNNAKEPQNRRATIDLN
jgi:outer membrane protein OmpA-like peptidoglycan-associated protein